MKFNLEPVNHDKISDLCGPTNSILKQIEEELGIKILNRGASFRIKGETSSAVSYTHLTLPTKRIV